MRGGAGRNRPVDATYSAYRAPSSSDDRNLASSRAAVAFSRMATTTSMARVMAWGAARTQPTIDAM